MQRLASRGEGCYRSGMRAPLNNVCTGLAGAMAGVWLTGCLDYNVSRMKPEDDASETGRIAGVDTGSGIDTGLCAGMPAVASGVAINESCVSVPVFGTLDAMVEWRTTDLGDMREYAHVLMAPAVGPLFDTDGDGYVDADDASMIVVTTDDGGADDGNSHGVLRIVDGRDGTPQVSVSRVMADDTQVFPYRYGGVALGDIDGSGTPRIVVLVSIVGGPPDEGPPGDGEDTAPPGDGGETGGGPEDTGVVVRPGVPAPPPPSNAPCRVAAFNPDGTLFWLAAEPALGCGGHAPALADLDGDGTVEVILGSSLFAGADGRWLSSGDAGDGRPDGFGEAGFMSFGADLYGDGSQDLVTGSALYESDGDLRCVTGYDDGFPAVADLDGNGTGDLVVVSAGWLRIFEADCALRLEVPLAGSGFGGPPTLGDLDADGLPEIGVANAEDYTAYEADGTVIWSMPISDWSSSSAGASFFDFDGDGGLEVVYADETSLWIFDGGTGEVRLQDNNHTSRTLHELPVVVDVDGDGMTEIVVPNGGTHWETSAVGLTVLGSEDGSWTTNRRVWNQHAYSISNVNDDLSIPPAPMSNWPTWNTFRSGTIDPVSGGAWPDAVPVVETCLDACDNGRMYLDVAVGNQGMAGLRWNVPVSVYAGETLLATAWTTHVVASGAVSETLTFELDAAQASGTLRVSVDDDGTGVGQVDECSEVNNGTEEPGCE